jgi:hypothetical protein
MRPACRGRHDSSCTRCACSRNGGPEASPARDTSSRAAASSGHRVRAARDNRHNRRKCARASSQLPSHDTTHTRRVPARRYVARDTSDNRHGQGARCGPPRRGSSCTPWSACPRAARDSSCTRYGLCSRDRAHSGGTSRTLRRPTSARAATRRGSRRSLDGPFSWTRR